MSDRLPAARRPTIAALAEAFLEQRQDRYRYGRLDRRKRRAWFIWNGARWEEDQTLAVYDDARNFARAAGCRVSSSCVEAIVRRARLSLTEDA